MARPTKEPAKLLQKFATRIRAELDTLVEQYDARLAERPGYNRLPTAMRRDLERQLLNLIADALAQGDSRELVEHVRQRAVQWNAAGLDMDWFQASLTVPEEILVPLIDSVNASTFLWQALNRSHDTVWQIIAERARQAEQTLRQSQQLLQTVMDNIPQAVFWKDQNLTYLGCNRAFAEDAGLASPLEIVGKTDWDMPWKEQADLYRADDGRVMESGTPKLDYEELQTTPAGETSWLRTSKVPMHDAAGKVTAVLGMYEDITERKRAEAALASERNLLRTLIDNLPDQVFFKDATGRIMLYNEADARAMGITSTDEAVGKTVYDLYPRELADLYNADDMAVIHSDQPLIDREEPGIDEAGQPRWILTTKVPLKDAQGKRLGLVGVARDITARRKIELSLQQSEERFRRLSEATSEGLVFHDKGVILDANPAVIAMFGFNAAADMIGRNILEVIVPECHPLVMQKMQQEDVHPYEIACTRQDGTRFPVETATRTYQYEDRTVRASSIRDITRRKQLEQSIRESFERRGREVEVSRQVAQEIATATDVDDIFPLVVKLIKERFDYYHAQIFRYDPAQDAVVLLTGYGEAGQQMLAAGHRLAMGRGVVGTAAKTGESILATDSAADEDWRPNPYLPNTKGELAVPIKFQDEMLGILDVQSDRVNALTQDDVLLLEGLAGQVAVAIASTRTLEAAHTFQALVEAAGQGIAFAGPDGHLSYVNAAVARMFGMPSADAIIGLPITDFYPASEHARVRESVVAAIEHGQWTGELNIQPADQTPPLSTINNVFTIRDRKGDLRYVANIITDITERKLAEQRLADAVRLAKIGYWSYDVPTDTFTFNDQFYTLMHTTIEREGTYTMSSGQYTQRFVHPDDAGMVGGEIGKALETTDPNYRGEVSHRVYFGDGELGYVTVRFTIEQDAHGRTIRTSGANQDITEVKRAEEGLRASETQLSQALHIAKLAYWQYDVEKDLFLFNDQFFSIFHTTADQHGGYQLTSAYYAQHFVYPDDLPIVGAEIEKALNSTDQHYSRALEHRIQYADGGIGHISVSINIDRDDQGKILRYYGANQDITERKLADEAVRRSEEQLAEAQRLAQLANWEFDVVTSTFTFNDQFYALLHTTAEREGGYRMSPMHYAQRFVHPEDAPLVGQVIQQALESADPHYRGHAEHRVLYADGGLGYFSVNFAVAEFTDGRVIKTYGANQDITERKLAEEIVRRSEAQLSEALKTARLAYWELDLARQKFVFNDQFYALLHTTAEVEGGYEMDVNAYVGRFIYPEDIAYVGTSIAQGLQNPDPTVATQLEARVVCADGEVRWLATQVSTRVDEAGQPIKTIGTNQDITDRKLAEEAVRRSQAELSQALQIAKLAYWEYDVEKDLFLFNDQFFSIFHTTAEQHGGYQLTSAYYAEHFVYPDDLPVVGAAIEQALNSTDRHYNRSLEHRILYADGGIGYISVSINIDRDDQGKILRYYGANQDITDRKLAEETIRRSEAELSQALQIAKLAYWEYDVEKDLFLFNDQFFSIFHTTADQHGGYQLTSAYYAEHFVYPDDLPVVGTAIEQALNSTDRHYSRSVEHRILYADGGIGYISVSINIDRDEQGRILRYYGANQDITSRKHAEEEVQRSEQLMRTVIDSTPDWIFIKDQGHRYRLVNQGYANSLHIPVDNFIGKDDLELGFPEDLVKGNSEKGIAGFWADDRAVMDSGQPKVIPNDIVSIDGALHIYNTIKTPLRDVAGNVWAVLAFARDITEREQLLQDVQRRANQVEAVAEVGAASAALLEPQALLDNVVRLTRRRFNLYHCHIYLLDEVSRTLKVQACGWRNPEDENRPAGEHAVRFDAARSAVAQAARTRQPVIDNDVHADPGWRPNPLLPDVQSEIALPMIVGDKVLGVFSAQADERDHFTDEDAQAMIALATQAAVALQNARLFEQTQRTAEELDLLNRRLTGEAWEVYLQRKTREHVILAKSDNRTAPAALPALNEPLAAGQVIVEQAADQPERTITTPIVLRGQTVGALRIQAGSEDWNEDVQSVLTSIASHIAQAAENTRLLEESEIRFARERALAEASDKIRRRPEVASVLEVAAAELAQYLQASAVSVRVGKHDNGQSG